MKTDRIESISAYCDNWCERCAYTSRCSAYAIQAAFGMCGDPAAAVELAIGQPRATSDRRPVPLQSEPRSSLTGPELATFTRQEQARNGKVRSTPLMNGAWAVGMLAMRWLSARAEAIRELGDNVLREAIDVARHDAFLITAKLNRASRGLLDYQLGEARGEDPIQNDWNGSAKLALICLERSEPAWQAIAQATRDDTAAQIAAQLGDVRRLTIQSFPDAHRFIRPGFDEPWR